MNLRKEANYCLPRALIFSGRNANQKQGEFPSIWPLFAPCHQISPDVLRQDDNCLLATGEWELSARFRVRWPHRDPFGDPVRIDFGTGSPPSSTSIASSHVRSANKAQTVGFYCLPADGRRIPQSQATEFSSHRDGVSDKLAPI